jgi:hypothetical protein
MRIASAIVLAGVAAALLAGCASTVEDSWTDPSVAGQRLGFQKVATVALLQEGALRRVAEDELARAIEMRASAAGGAVVAVPSYTLLAVADLADAQGARAKLAEAGFDGAVIVSVVDSQQRVTSTPGVSTMGRGWGGGAWMIHDTQVRTDTIVRVQTNIYSVAEGRLLWSGTSRTLNPRDVRGLIDDVVRDVGGALREQGLVR